MSNEEYRLRRLLWLAHNDGTAYGDDGEMQLRGVDFKRDSVDRIEEAITQWGRERVAVAWHEQAGSPAE